MRITPRIFVFELHILCQVLPTTWRSYGGHRFWVTSLHYTYTALIACLSISLCCCARGVQFTIVPCIQSAVCEKQSRLLTFSNNNYSYSLHHRMHPVDPLVDMPTTLLLTSQSIRCRHGSVYNKYDSWREVKYDHTMRKQGSCLEKET